MKMKLLTINISLSIIFLCFASFSCAEQISPYKDFSNDGVQFYGHDGEPDAPENLEAIYLGLMGPGKTPEGEQLRNGVAMAIEEANKKGGYNGIPYKIVFRPDDGPWGVTAKQVVHLAYEDKVWLILGALEGKQAHLAELISAKVWIPVLTTYASDLSIDYANVPWIFRFTPDDSRQALALLRHARINGYKRLVVLTAGDRESSTGFMRIKDASKDERYPITVHIEYDPYNATAILPRLQNIEMDAVLIWGDSKSVLSLFQAFREGNMNVPVLLPASLATPDIAQESKYSGKVIVTAPFDMSRNDELILAFQQNYQELAGTSPSPIAFFAYDATRMAIVAVQRAGLNRVRIREELARMVFDGITGQIRFDSLGGNPVEPILFTIQNGKWIKLQD